jgi:hypothetical protein
VSIAKVMHFHFRKIDDIYNINKLYREYFIKETIKMQSVKEIEDAIIKLSKSDLINFRDWFEKFDQEEWDKQFEKDVKSGKLDALAEQAILDFKAGKCKVV